MPPRLLVGCLLISGVLVMARCTGGAPQSAGSEEAPPPTAEPSVTQVVSSPSPAPQATASPAPTAEPTPAVLLAVGDIASCDSLGDEAVALLVSERQGTVATLGDTVYPSGSPQEFSDCYDPVWGAFKDRTRPSLGNHEYLTAGAAGYFDYFGTAAGETGLGYYSYDLGAWHIVVLNSMCWEVGGCGHEAAQAQWLAADLKDHPAACTLAYWHFPRFSSGRHGSSDLVSAYWNLLHEGGADVVLTGHDHDYERFAPQGPQGEADPEYGVREFVVGTGGFSHYPFPGKPIANSETRDASSDGILVLQLYPDSYEWEFVPAGGDPFSDRGVSSCHPAPGAG